MFKQNLFKQLLSILAVVSIASFAGVGASYAAGDEIPAETDQSDKQEKCEKSGGIWSDDVCKCEKVNTVEKDGMCVCKNGYKLDGAESLAEENAKCVVDENSGTGSTETPTGSDPVGAATGIKIATKSFNDARFSYVRRDLDNTIATIRDVVSNAITNTNNIAALQSGKQTRPDDNHSCAEGKTCLLVTDTSGTHNWYEIIDCGETLPSFGTYSSLNVEYGPGEPWGFSVSGQTDDKLMCRSEVIACNNNEWVTPYSKALVYGTARRVGIVGQTPGTVVKLPTNVQSGNVCVCKATRYRMYTGDLSAQGQTAVIGDSQSISTDDWFVAGVASNDVGCFNMCGADSHSNGVSKLSYLAGISNACMVAANTAQMCRYHPFFATVASTSSSEHAGWVTGGSGSGDCRTDGHLAGISHCSTNGSWVVDYGNNGILGYVYGTVGYATVPSGAAVGDVVDLDVSTVSATGSAGDNAIVCVAQGYKTASDTSETNVSLNKVLVIMVGDYSNGTDASGASENCMGVGYIDPTNFGYGMNWYNQLSNICVAY